MEFHALHISDIHFDDESTSRKEFRREIAKKILSDQLNADCLIISGDLFNRGSLDGSRIDEYKVFIKRLPGNGCILAVPGNHDLDRSAQETKTGSFNAYTTRRSLVLAKGDIAKEAGKEFELTDDEKNILYKITFQAFRSFAREMGFQSFCQDDSKLTAENYEVQVVDLPFDDESSYKVRVVLLNTALIAGQSVRGKLYRERQSKLESESQRALADGDSVRAAEINVKIARLQKRYEDDGELIVDEETEGESGRLSLSKAGNQRLSELESDNAVLTIFVGHHGFQYLSKETQEALKLAMKSCNSGIYLCGHAHKARYRRFPIQQRSFPKDVEQIQAGVMFKDETSISQYGFDYVSLALEKGKLDLKITSYFLVKGASEEQRWLRENLIDYSYYLPKIESPENEPVNTVDKENIEGNTDPTIPHDSLIPLNPPSGRPAATHNLRLAAMFLGNGNETTERS